MKKSIPTGRNCRLFRPMTLKEAKALCLALSEQLAHESTRAQRTPHPFRLRLYAVKTRLAKGSLLLHVRFLCGSKKGTDGHHPGLCFAAHVERMLKSRQRDPPTD